MLEKENYQLVNKLFSFLSNPYVGYGLDTVGCRVLFFTLCFAVWYSDFYEIKCANIFRLRKYLNSPFSQKMV